MKCCNEQSLYVESDPKIHKERHGESVVMCSSCHWSDKYVFMKKELAESRMTELKNGSAAETTESFMKEYVQEYGNDQVMENTVNENKPLDLITDINDGVSFPISADMPIIQNELPESSVKAMLDAENLQFGK
jgi:hypothetical protein